MITRGQMVSSKCRMIDEVQEVSTMFSVVYNPYLGGKWPVCLWKQTL